MRLFWKLFLLQLVAVTVVVGGALVVTRVHTQRGFAEFVEKREAERVAQIAERLGEVYEHSFDLGEAWDTLPALRRAEHRRLPEREVVEEIREGRRVMVQRQVLRAPLQLQDLDGQFVRGDPRMPPELMVRVPIESDGHVVGYLAWPKKPRHPEEDEFAERQLKHLFRVSLYGLVVAALFAALITALIVRPIRRLSGGAAALARREFAVRVPEGRRDELGDLAADFNRLASALEGYDTRQRQWLADISHELRTPLAVLRGEIEALVDGLRQPDANALRSLRQEVGRLEALIRDLQLVSQAESGALRLNRAETDLGALALQSGERFRERLKTRGFALTLDATPGLVASVDAQRMEQVLANLLENALRHAAPPGPVELTARAEADRIVLRVSDAGPGVPADALPRLFDRLYRVDSARTRASGGAGLGLAICKSIVEAHGGTIEARPSASGGLEILISLSPLAGRGPG
jgi:two-component system sensor histidine kinase BaeS